MSSKNKKRSKKLVVSFLIITILLGIVSIFYFFQSNKSLENEKTTIKTTTQTTTKAPNKTINTVLDLNSNSRNIAVMVNNISTVWGYQSGLQDAYLIYEVITEGGISRLMAIYKDAKTDRIGSVRSSRIYYLDYVLENDAVYVHIGGSKEALSDIKKLGITDLQSEVTFRDRTMGLRYEHTAFATMEKIYNRIEKRKIRMTTTKKNLLNYSTEEIDLSQMEGAIKANEVYMLYSKNKSTSFTYDEETKLYKRFQNYKEHIDYVTKKQYTAKNIITYQIKNSSYDSYGRQALDNLGKGEGYFISNGYAVPITWEKSSREAQTVYRYKSGKEITVNYGNTYIQIQPKNREFSIK